MARILYFSRDYTPHDHRYLSALAETHHRVAYLRLERRGNGHEDRPLPPEIEIIPWTGGRAAVSWRDGPRLLAALRGVIRRFQPDLIHAGPLQRSAFLAALSGFRPLVSMSWGYDLIHDARRNALWRWATRFTLRRSAAMIGDCETIRRLAVAYGMSAGRIVAYPWGVDLAYFAPAAGERGEGPFTLLSTRAWEPIYGVEVIARAFVLAARQRPDLRLVMLGGGSQAALLRSIFQQGGVEQRVYFPGLARYADLPRFYRSADLYLSASHSDGASISLLEALACGLPALTSDIPGNREWVQPGVQGWLFPDGDEHALARGILHAEEQRQALSEIGRAARTLAEQRADWRRNFEQLMGAYRIALNLEQSL
ncbi:MAG: glycosyltransferase [Chloroflexi bacterium]|nr:glycosyltransferase [Chloroflexota bacterium]